MVKCSGSQCKRIPEPPFKTCSTCRQSNRKHREKRFIEGLCRHCRRPRLSDKSVCQHHASRHKVYRVERYQKAKDSVFAHYGESCACCGERESVFLTIDHITGGGTKHVKSLAKNFYDWLVVNGFPSGFQTLCYNCNVGKYRNGGTCPHQTMPQSKTVRACTETRGDSRT